MGTTIANMRGSGDWTVPDHRPKDWLQKAFQLFPEGNAKLVYLLSKLPRRAIRDYEFNIFEDRLPDMSFTVNGEVAINATTINIDAPATNLVKGLKAGDELLDETSGEIVRVVANPSSPWTSITVERYIGASNTGATIATDSILRWSGSAYGEGTQAPASRTRNPDRVTNYLQIHKETAKITGSAMEMESRPFKAAWTREKALALERYVNKMEYSFMFSAKADSTDAEGNRLSTTNGLYRVISTNSTDFSTNGVSLDALEDALETIFKYGSDQKVFLCGNRALTIANRVVARNTMGNWALESVPKKESYGLRVKRWYTPHGEFVLMPHKLMTQSAAHKKWAWILDTKYMELVYMQNRFTKFKDNAQLPDEDARKGYYQGELGIGLALEETHGVFQGMNTYVA